MKFIGKSSLKSQVVFHRLVHLDITGLGGTKLVGTGNSIDMNCLLQIFNGSVLLSVIISIVIVTSQVPLPTCNLTNCHFYCHCHSRVAEVGSLSARAKMGITNFVNSIFTFFSRDKCVVFCA